MSITDHNEGELSQAARERIDEFSRELALALKRILNETKDQEGIHLPESIKAKPIANDEEKSKK